MREFKSLQPEGLRDAYDAEIHGEEPMVTVKESEGCITIHYTFPGFYLSDDSREIEGETIPFEQINIAETGFLTESGKPLLPSFGRYVQIPFNCKYTITTEESKPIQFENILIVPAQQMVTDTEDDSFEYDRTFYAKDQYYPEKIVDVSGPFKIDSYNALLVHVRPLQYNPAKKMLRGFSTITVTIEITPEGEYALPLTDSELDKEAYGNLFLNPKKGIHNRLSTDDDTVSARYSAAPRGPEFLIIYHQTFKEAAEKLAKWKNKRGLPTGTVSLSKVGTGENALKTYIRTKRNPPSSKLRYVLLFGDADTIPPEKIESKIYSDINATDYYYSTEKDAIEETDLRFPWLSIGRIPVKTAEEGMAVVNEIIAYEKEPPPNPEYYTKMVFAAYFEDIGGDGRADSAYIKTMEYIRNHMITLGFDVERVYVTTNPNVQKYKDGTDVPEEVKKAILLDKQKATDKLISATSKGCLIIAHRDHGSYQGWKDPPFKKNHLKTVTGEVPSIFYSINCMTGHFDKELGESFAERLLKMKGGAPSLIAATRESFPPLNDQLMKALFDAMWAGVLPTFSGGTASYPLRYNRLGDILNYAKAYLPLTSSNGLGHIKDHFEIYHVIGDPTLELLRAKPAKMNIGVKENQGRLDIVLGACPNGSVITVWHGDKMLKRIQPNYSHVSVSLRDPALQPISPGDISVCFWAPGYRFRQVVV